MIDIQWYSPSQPGKVLFVIVVVLSRLHEYRRDRVKYCSSLVGYQHDYMNIVIVMAMGY